MARLREETQVQHRSIEAALDAQPYFYDSDAYTRLLRRLAGFTRAVEPRLGLSGAWERLGLTPRPKAPLLEADLTHFGLGWEDAPPCDALPDLSTPSRAVGALYVLEGSMLGAQIISRWLRERMALEPGAGASYFGGYGRATGARWREFAAAVEQAAPELVEDEVVDGARETFEALEAWIGREAAVV